MVLKIKDTKRKKKRASKSKFWFLFYLALFGVIYYIYHRYQTDPSWLEYYWNYYKK